MPDIQEIKDKVFEFLVDKHFEEKKEGKDFFFMIRLGTNEIFVSFWLVGSTFISMEVPESKIPFISLIIKSEKEVGLFIDNRGNEKVLPHFQELSGKVPGLTKLNDGQWEKEYTKEHGGNYIKYLEEFLEEDKKIIDAFVDGIKQKKEKDNNSLPNSGFGMTGLFPFIRKMTTDDFYFTLTMVMDRKCRTRDYFFTKETTNVAEMPFSLKSLEVRNYRGIEHLRLEGIPVNAKWIVLTGENGYGKSSVLQSIAIGLFGNEDGSRKLLDDKGFVLLEGKSNGTRFLNLSFNYNNTGRPFTSIGKHLSVYGASRLGNENNDPGNERIYRNLFSQKGCFINIETELIKANGYVELKHKFKLLKDAFCELIFGDLADIKVEVIEGNPVVRYKEKDIEGNTYQDVSFEQLASGYRSIIAMVGDIISRLSEGQSDLKSLHELKGVVIIDELELHLHPKYQKLLPQKLSELFPNILFIASTHSPIPLLGMPKETAFIKVNRNAENGITAEIIKLEVDITKLSPDAILSSPIFGFQEIFSDNLKNVSELNTSESYDEAKLMEGLKKKFLKIKEEK